MSHYEGLGDGALQASDPESACRYWQSALALDPENSRVKTKLEEARDEVRSDLSIEVGATWQGESRDDLLGDQSILSDDHFGGDAMLVLP